VSNVITPIASRSGPQPALVALVADDGTNAVAFARALAMSGAAPRDLADAMHALCAVHGRHPGVIDHALARTANSPPWLIEAADSFARERGYLAHLTAAAGPVPSTPGQAETEAAVAGQRHAFDMLARSDREGCALGATAALLLDWRAIRRVIDAAARRFGLSPLAMALPDASVLLSGLPGGGAADRAVAFGAQQVLAQHRGLWHLLEARAAARGVD
jgi:hypothetical protein